MKKGIDIMKFYHLTPIKNVNSILHEGLKVNKEPFASIEDNSDKIYLTTSIEKLLVQEGEWNNNIAIFKIDYLKIIGIDMHIDREQNYSKLESPFSFYICENVQPQCLTYISKIINGKILNI